MVENSFLTFLEMEEATEKAGVVPIPRYHPKVTPIIWQKEGLKSQEFYL